MISPKFLFGEMHLFGGKLQIDEKNHILNFLRAPSIEISEYAFNDIFENPTHMPTGIS